jgi:hypothetical protein
MSPREVHAAQQVAADEARLDGKLDGKYVGERSAGRRTNATMAQVVVEFWKHPSPYLLGTVIVGALVGRVLSGPGSWWELAIPVGLVAILPFVEWGIHVGILHWKPRKVAGLTVDPLLSRKHRAHHSNPREIPLVFIPWQVSLYLAPLNVLVWWLVMPTTSSMFTMLLSVYVIMTTYEWTHYLLHSDYRPKSAAYRKIWRNHRLHHYKSEHYWFTVTSAGTADRLLGTAPDPSTVPTSPTVQRLHDLSL